MANRNDCVSLEGSLILLDKSLISWRTFKERGVSLSNMENEHITIVNWIIDVCQLIWLSRILSDCYDFKFINVKPVLPSKYADNQ